MKKKLLCILLAAMMLLSMAACGGTGSDTPAPETEAPAAPAENPPEAPEEPAPDTPEEPEEPAAPDGVYGVDLPMSAITANLPPVELPLVDEECEIEVWMATPGPASHEEDLANSNEVWAEIQRRTGVDIVFVLANFFTQQDQFNLMVSSGDLVAVMNNVMGLYSGGPDGAIEEDLFINLADYLEYAPNYSAIINSDPQIYSEVTTTGGNLAAFYSFHEYNKWGGKGDKGYFIRQDWLDELGLDMPTTYDELHDVLVIFRDEKGATSAFAPQTSGLSDFMCAGFGFGGNQTGFIVVDGEIKFSPLEPGYREYLELMNTWYNEGLVYKDYYTFTNPFMFDDTAMLASGEVAVYHNEVSTMTSYAELMDDPFIVKAIAPLSKEKGGVVYNTEFRQTCVDTSRWTITTNCENPEIVVRVADYLYSQEGILLGNYGIEGVTFNYDDNGKPVLADWILYPSDGYAARDMLALHLNDAAGTVLDARRLAVNYTDLQLSAYDDWLSANIDFSRNLPTDDLLNAEEKMEYSRIYSDIQTFVEEQLNKYIIGQASFDTYDTDFVGKIESMNIQRCIELYQQAYDRYMETH